MNSHLLGILYLTGNNTPKQSHACPAITMKMPEVKELIKT